jgi:hypothetical protein
MPTVQFVWPGDKTGKRIKRLCPYFVILPFGALLCSNAVFSLSLFSLLSLGF